ncbi:MAG: hypothetical protein WA771_16695 [Chthoniobacterales bacterium]
MSAGIGLRAEGPVETAVLLIAFNRPGPTAEVFEVLREVKPRRLWVAQDGARGHVLEDDAKCAAVREILESVDWDCEVKRLYREENVGCGVAVSEAISWFLEDAGEGIILEDDTLPSRAFFPFCAEMLERCRDDDRVASISGDCFLPERMQDALTADGVGAYRSKYFNMWGWATWRDRWEGYSLKLEDRSAEEWDSVIDEVHGETLEASVWRAILMALRSGILDTWDFQFAFHAWARGRGHVVPTGNLVTNLGFDADATHTVDQSPVAGLPRREPERLVLDGPVEADAELDGLTFYLRHLEGLRLTLWLKEGFMIDAQDRSERIPFEKQLVELQRACNERMALINKMSARIRTLESEATLTGQVKKLLRLK